MLGLQLTRWPGAGQCLGLRLSHPLLLSPWTPPPPAEPPGKETPKQCLWLQGPSASPTPASWPSGMERTERICSLFVLAVIGCTTQALDGPSINNGMVGWMGWVKRKEVGRLGGGLMDGRISSFGETDRLTDRISICGSQPLRLKR